MNYEQNLDDNSGNRWLQSIYWAVQSITSVGYGDMPADNEITMLIAIFTMLMGVVLCSWIMTNVLAAMNPDGSSKRFHERLQYVIAYLKNNQLPQGVAKRVITFYRWQNMNQFDEKSVLSDLPPTSGRTSSITCTPTRWWACPYSRTCQTSCHRGVPADVAHLVPAVPLGVRAGRARLRHVLHHEGVRRGAAERDAPQPQHR